MLLAANNIHNLSLSDIEWMIQELFWKYAKNFSEFQLPERPQDRVESEFQQRMELLKIWNTTLKIPYSENFYSTIEMACHLDTIEHILSSDVFTRDSIQELSKARREIAESLWLEVSVTWDRISHLLCSETNWLEIDTTPDQINGIIAANDNCSPTESLKSKRALDVIWILRLVWNLSWIQARHREIFLRELKKLDAQWKLEPEIYAQKYKLTLILEIPEMSTWEMIFSKLEQKYPEVQWVEKVA